MKEYLKVNQQGEQFVCQELREEYIKDIKYKVWNESLLCYDELEKIIMALTPEKIEELKLNIQFENLSYHLGRIKGYVK